mgnify:CR=1 FL=1
MPGKGISKAEQERRAQKVKDADLKKQRNFTSGAGQGKRKVNTTTPSSIYVPKEKKVNEITPKGVVQPGPLAKLGQREIDSEGPFRKNVTGPILKHCGGK